MNRIIALLVIAQFICLSQSAQVKRASDACPGANNKSNTSKDYASLSKRTAGSSDFSKPKYQSIYAKNTTANTPVKRGKAIAKEERTVSQSPATASKASPENKTTPIVREEKNKTSKTIREPEGEDEFESIPFEEKVETAKTMDVVQTEKALIPESKPVAKHDSTIEKEEDKTASSPNVTKDSFEVSSRTKSASKKSADMKTTKAAKQKQQKKNTTKKLRVGKKCATDCPEF